MRRIGRRAALTLPLVGLGGCSLLDNWLGESKTPIPGKREPVLAGSDSVLAPADALTPPAVPAPVANADWAQPGGVASHGMGNLAASSRLARAWSASIGDGGGYRRKITSQPVVLGGRVFTMDSDAVVSAFDLRGGSRQWRTDTQGDEDRSTNVGGGLAADGGFVYASTGRADMLALDAAAGSVKWRQKLPAPARSSPTVADGRVYVITIEDELVALAVDDGKRLWAYRATNAAAAVLGQPAPAFAEGLVVAGFGSGDLAGLRAGNGGVAWTDSLASVGGRTSLADLSSIRAMPVVADGVVYAVGLGGLLVALDLRTGRRVWDREIAGGQTPYLAGDWLYVLTTSQQLAALNRADGRAAWVSDLPRWETPDKQRDPIFWLGPVLVDGRLLLAGSIAAALTVSAATGQILGRQDLSGAAALAPIVASATVLIVTEDGSLLAYR